MEPRQLLAAVPLFVGAVYIEEDIGSDQHGDTFEITFEGGADGTELTRVAISGDQNAPGFNVGDVFFDTSDGGLGGDHAFPWTVISLQTDNPAATVDATVSDGGTMLVLDLSGFRAGDKLVFTVDVDEVEYYDPAETDLTIVNEGMDPLTSGVEFQGSTLTATFSSPHYHDAQATGEFRNRYDADLEGTSLVLPADDHSGKRDRSAGAVGNVLLEPLPVSVAGTVYLETDLDLTQDPGEIGLPDVELDLWRLDGVTYAFTGHSTKTDANGDYEFGTELALEPGVYQVRERQPAGLFSVGAIPGYVDGAPAGETVDGDPDVLSKIALELGGQQAVDFDFAEARPAEISGYVYHDRDNDSVRDAGEEGIGGASLQIIPVDTIGNQDVRSTTTDADGFYRVDGLAPGTYRVIQNVQPAGYLDGLDAAGSVAGHTRGVAVNPGDAIEDIFLGGGQAGMDYNFGELVPVSVRGTVRLADRYGECFVAGMENAPVADALVQLFDQQGNVLDETRTDGLGSYVFNGLAPGTYRLVETTPAHLIDGEDHVGTVQGLAVGAAVGDDTIIDIQLESGQTAIDYDFCEHLPAQVSGYVYHDRDDDGVKQAGQEGIAGVLVTLRDESGAMVTSATTDSQGFYAFTGLHAGVYTIAESQPQSWTDGLDRVGTVGGQAVGQTDQTDDRISQIALQWGDSGLDYNFGELRNATIIGSTHLTGPAGDCYSPTGGGPPLVGVRLVLLDEDGTQQAETVTDANGNYRFEDLRPGTYALREWTPDGLIDGAERVGTIDGVPTGRIDQNDLIVGITVLSGQTAIGYDFCEHEPASISGIVYHDEDNDGQVDDGEQRIEGVTVQLLDAANEVVETQVSDATGYYEFRGLPAGVYELREMQPAGYLDGLDSAGQIAGTVVGSAANPGDQISDIDLQWGDEGVQYNFGELLRGSIGGLVHIDLDGDCEMDGDEAPLSGVTVQLLDGQGQVLATTSTDSAGRYRFDNLEPGIYTIREEQPAGYLQGGQRAGTGGGDDSLTDVISAIALGSDQHLTDYDFCEVPPSDISGVVHEDLDADCQFDADELPLGGVTIELLDDGGRVLATTLTDNAGGYRFDNLAPGTYTVREIQPARYFQGGQRAGSGGGDDSRTDVISHIAVPAGEHLTDYDFCEVPPSEISGVIHEDLDADCQFDPDESPLAGVTVELLDDEGRVLATKLTDDAGHYRFDNLAPGTYSVREIQPTEYFQGGQRVGSGGGDDSLTDVISHIAVLGGQHLTSYDFCEVPPGHLSGYVFQDGAPLETSDGLPPKKLWEFRDGRKTPDDTPLAEVVLHLRDGDTGAPITGEMTLPGTNPAGPMLTKTDENGYYEFRGLRPGNYAVYEIHPKRYFDGLDTPGTTSGIVFNINSEVDLALIANLVERPENDAIVSIPVAAGSVSEHNNFSEVLVNRRFDWIPPDPLPIIDTPTPTSPVLAPPPLPAPPIVAALPVTKMSFDTLGSGGSPDFSWHLSIIDAGAPRGAAIPSAALAMRTIAFSSFTDWNAHPLHHGQWTLGRDGSQAESVGRDGVFQFGVRGAMPIVGDFNGDGVDEIGVYRKGYWFLDLNGNGRWDDEDLWAQLGGDLDFPITGDWNGDGKDDIGIFGPAWPGDTNALAVEAGLPDVCNRIQHVPKPKNVPPDATEATNGMRLLRHTAQGTTRADLIDHVFRYGAGVHIPVTGDWSGDGIKNIGVFEDGQWHLDEDGNGRWTAADREVAYGQVGDLPVVGDFDGDGIDEIGVYRQGSWIVDMDGNRQLDAHDELFTLGDAGDLPVVGDWDGDGIDDPGIYRPESPADGPTGE